MPLFNSKLMNLRNSIAASIAVDKRILSMQRVSYSVASPYEAFPRGIPDPLDEFLRCLEANQFLIYWRRLLFRDRNEVVIVAKGKCYAIVFKYLVEGDLDLIYIELVYRHVLKSQATDVKCRSILCAFEKAATTAGLDGIFLEVQPVALSCRLPFRDRDEHGEWLGDSQSLTKYYMGLGYLLNDEWEGGVGLYKTLKFREQAINQSSVSRNIDPTL